MKTLLFTGGIGDVLTLDAHMPREVRESCQRVYWAAPNQRAMIPLFQACPAWRHVEHKIIWDRWGARRSFHRLVELRSLLRGSGVDLAHVEDWSISVRFRQIRHGELPFRGSTLTSETLASVARFGLPPRYAVVCPATVSLHRGHRHFLPEDWTGVLAWLEADDTVGVVLNTGDDPIPKGPRLLNLSNRTSLAEAIEIAKGADAYLGINSCLSVVAGWSVPRGRIFIKSRDNHTVSHIRTYYPKQEGLRLLPSLAGIQPEGVRDHWEPLDGLPGLVHNTRGTVKDVEQRPTAEYGTDYWAKYERYARTPLGERLTEFRADLVARHGQGVVLDIGVGCGAFLAELERRGIARAGYDVNPVAIAHLQAEGLYRDPWQGWPEGVGRVTFWDALEHIPDAPALVARVPIGTHVFVSMPVLRGGFHRLGAWKHYRPGEHLWYWSPDGFLEFMINRGFAVRRITTKESILGREDIWTWVFERVKA